MFEVVCSSHLAKDKMDSSISQDLSLPSRFGKCLNFPSSNHRDLKIKETHPLPKKEPKGDELVSYVLENLKLKGKLTLDSRGFFYVDLDDRYIYELFDRLNETGAEIPPYFFPGGYGAHISVALSSESFQREQATSLLGTEISFTITDCYFVKPEGWEGIKRVWFLTIEAPDLSNIRKELGLSAKIHDHEFHITFAIEKDFLSLDDFISVKEDKEGNNFIEINSAQARKRKIRHMQRLNDFC